MAMNNGIPEVNSGIEDIKQNMTDADSHLN